MLHALAAGVLFAVGVGMVVYIVAGTALSLVISRWLAAQPARSRQAFLIEHSSVEDVAAQLAMPLACGTVGAIAIVLANG